MQASSSCESCAAGRHQPKHGQAKCVPCIDQNHCGNASPLPAKTKIEQIMDMEESTYAMETRNAQTRHQHQQVKGAGVGNPQIPVDIYGAACGGADDDVVGEWSRCDRSCGKGKKFRYRKTLTCETGQMYETTYLQVYDYYQCGALFLLLTLYFVL